MTLDEDYTVARHDEPHFYGMRQAAVVYKVFRNDQLLIYTSAPTIATSKISSVSVTSLRRLPPAMSSSSSPLDILCKVAAAERSAISSKPNPAPPPSPPSPPPPPRRLPPIRAPYSPPLLHHRTSSPRLSSSAPSHHAILSGSSLPEYPTMFLPTSQYASSRSALPAAPFMVQQSALPRSLPRSFHAPSPAHSSAPSVHSQQFHPSPLYSPLHSSRPDSQSMPRNLSAPTLRPSHSSANSMSSHPIPVTRQQGAADHARFGPEDPLYNSSYSFIPRPPPSASIPIQHPAVPVLTMRHQQSSSSLPPVSLPGIALSPVGYGSSPASLSRPRVSYGSPGSMKGVSGRASKSTGRRDSYTRFTAEEEAMLLDGVRVFGVGNWKKILNSYRFHWKRTAVDLKDKYRNMTRAKMRRINANNSGNSSNSSPCSHSNTSTTSAGIKNHLSGKRGSVDDNRVSYLPGYYSMMGKRGQDLKNRVQISPISTPNTTPSGSVEEKSIS